MTVTRVITACDEAGASVDVSVKVSAAHSASDPSQTFTIDPQSMAGAFMSGEAKVGYSKAGAAKSFNAAAEDRTAQVTSGAVSAFLKLAPLLTARPQAGPAGAACSDEVMKALGTGRAAAAALKNVETFAWPPDGSTFHEERAASDGLAAMWASKGRFLAVAPLQLRMIDATSGADLRPSVSDTASPLGIPYRMPRAVRLLVCDGDCQLGNQLISDIVHVVQAGPMYYLPCESRRFTSTVCALAMDEGGVPVSAGTAQKGAPAEGVLGAAKGH